MAALISLDPAPYITRSSVDIIAVEAGRSRDGLVATVQAINGTIQAVQAARLVKLANADDRGTFSEEISQATGLPVKDAEGALLELMAGVGNALRAQESGTRQPPASQATRLVALAEAAELFHSPYGEAYATLMVSGHRETWRLKSREFSQWLRRQFYEEKGNVPSSQALQDALGVLEGKAQFDGPQYAVFTRLAEHDGCIYLDLANEGWQVIKITTTGWREAVELPVRFRRPRGMLPLPYPLPGGSIEELRAFVNLPCDRESEWILLVGWLLGALRPCGPYPVLVLHGEQGSAKSTTVRLLRALIDPNKAPLRAEPRNARDLMIAAINGRCLSFDNLSHLPPWLSDAICRLATGGGFATRALHTDSDEVLFDAQRPVILNGIEELATRGDLLDRALILYLPPIPEHQRRPESDIWHDFEVVRPRILGALLDAVSHALARLPTVTLDRLPRMADFAHWVAAAEGSLPWQGSAFMNAYTGNRETANNLALEVSLVAAAIHRLADTGEFGGTATELLGKLNSVIEDQMKRQSEWPKNGRALTNALRRIAPNLRAVGIDITFLRRTSMRRLISMRRIAPPGDREIIHI